VIHTHYPRERDLGIEIMEQEAGIDLGGEFPVVVPYFMKEIIEQISVRPAESKYIDQQSGVSARFQHRQLPHDGRQRPAARGSCWAKARPCRGSATWATSTPRRWASWNWT
jgi:magnesium chelatase subunit I